MSIDANAHSPEPAAPAAMRTDDLHRALRGSTRRPINGHFFLAVLAAIGLVALVFSEQPAIEKAQNRTTKTPPVDIDVEVKTPKIDLFDPGPDAFDRELARLERERLERERLKAVAAAYKAPPLPAGHVRVAAIQYCSAFGRPKFNRKSLAVLIRKAARPQIGAKIIVLPEAAIPGYANMTYDTYWSEDPLIEKKQQQELDELDLDEIKNQSIYKYVGRVAEKIDGASFKYFSPIAKEYGIYLTVPIIEKAVTPAADKNRPKRKNKKNVTKYYNTVLLLDPQGKVAIHYRKQQLWDPGDVAWASEGDLGSPIIDTPYGRITLMICYDMHAVLPSLEGRKVDFVLHSAAFYGTNFEGYLRSNRFRWLVQKSGANLILANWSTTDNPWWSGWGMSRIQTRDWTKRWRIKSDRGNGIVIGDLPTGKTWRKMQAEKAATEKAKENLK